MDLDYMGLRRSVRESIQWVVLFGRGKVEAAFPRVAFSSRREVLAARKEANCCWWESSFSSTAS